MIDSLLDPASGHNKLVNGAHYNRVTSY